MGRLSFVVMLFVMALACFVLALTDGSWGWAIGAVIFLAVGIMARRQYGAEGDSEDGPEVASNKFIMVAFLALFAGFGAIFFLATA